MYAHSPNEAGDWQGLTEHLEAVAGAASAFAAPFGGGRAAQIAGLWHDVGKAGNWQSYLAKCAAEPDRRHRSVDHKGAGALIAASDPALEVLAFLIAGHHGGLMNHGDLRSWLKERRQDADTGLARDWAESVGVIASAGNDFDQVIPEFARSNPHALEFWLRMCFSALVDADYRDTERHFDPVSFANRGGAPPIPVLAKRLEAAQAALNEAHQGPVNAVRREVYQACLGAAELPPGLFRLTVPTGGGKTRSGLSFGLRHAATHGFQRVVVALPFLTITDQTAEVYRQVLGDDQVVLEHYSSAGAAEDPDGAVSQGEVWRRLSAQDWDAPVVVTTTVQLLESLFGGSTRACRKLHRLANAVIILDEVQSLPVALLEPILDVLTELAANYGTSVVFCTATQPEYGSVPKIAERFAAMTEIAPEPARLFQSLQRVTYAWPEPGDRWSWARVAAEAQASEQTLIVVNTKRDALALLDELADPEAFHLSTAMCAAHRRDVLSLIRLWLKAGRRCRVVSTQVVEAGVDLDFPLVMRALGPLDSIVQAAGRCNREGHLHRGRVIIFDPEEGGSPGGSYATATTIAAQLAAEPDLDLHDPEVFRRYFSELYSLVDLDARDIQGLRSRFAFADVAKAFKMIDDDTVPVLVDYRGLAARFPDLPTDRRAIHHATTLAKLIDRLELAQATRSLKDARALLGQAQPYTVALRRRAFEQARQAGNVTELVGDLWHWQWTYDDVRGLTFDADHERLVV